MADNQAPTVERATASPVTAEQRASLEKSTNAINEVSHNFAITVEHLRKFESMLSAFTGIFVGFSLDSFCLDLEQFNGRRTTMADLIQFTFNVDSQCPELLHLESQQCTLLEYLSTHGLTFLINGDITKEMAEASPLDNFLMPNSYINNHIDALINQGPTLINPSGKSEGRGAYSVKCAIRINADLFPPSFTQLDRLVFNGACTLYEAGRPYFTPLHVYNAFSGANVKHLRPELKAQIVDSIEKQATTLIKIDATAEMQARGYDINNFYLKSNCLALRGFEATLNGQQAEAYSFLTEPILLTYSKQLKQVITVERKLLQVEGHNGKAKRNTLQFSVVKQYLLQRLEIIRKRQAKKGKVRGYNHIKFTTFYENTGAKTPKQQRRAYGQATEAFDYWQKIGYLKKWNENRKAGYFEVEF